MKMEKTKHIKLLIYLAYLVGIIAFIICMITKSKLFYSISTLSMIIIVCLSFIFDKLILKIKVSKIKLVAIFITILSGALLLISINNTNIYIDSKLIYIEAIVLLAGFNLAI